MDGRSVDSELRAQPLDGKDGPVRVCNAMLAIIAWLGEIKGGEVPLSRNPFPNFSEQWRNAPSELPFPTNQA